MVKDPTIYYAPILRHLAGLPLLERIAFTNYLWLVPLPIQIINKKTVYSLLLRKLQDKKKLLDTVRTLNEEIEVSLDQTKLMLSLFGIKSTKDGTFPIQIDVKMMDILNQLGGLDPTIHLIHVYIKPDKQYFFEGRNITYHLNAMMRPNLGQLGGWDHPDSIDSKRGLNGFYRNLAEYFPELMDDNDYFNNWKDRQSFSATFFHIPTSTYHEQTLFNSGVGDEEEAPKFWAMTEFNINAKDKKDWIYNIYPNPLFTQFRLALIERLKLIEGFNPIFDVVRGLAMYKVLQPNTDFKSEYGFWIDSINSAWRQIDF